MSSDEPTEGDGPDDAPPEATGETRSPRERLEAEADRAVTEFDEGIVDLLAWLLDTETRARIYVYLRQHPNATSEEVADGTGLYPSTVREALAELHEEGTVSRHKRQNEGAGNNPYEYEAIAPSELVHGVVREVQDQLNTVFNLDSRLGDADQRDESGPVRITVEDAAETSGGDRSGEGDATEDAGGE
ncbi:MAG: helix-turn-helix domain-containing protein [Haloferacaceae archaeon]